MHEVFRAHMDSLPAALTQLIAMPPVKCGSLPKHMPKRGIYLFSEGDLRLYVGRSNRMRQRVRNHGNPAATHRQAAFAFKLAREATGKAKATYKPDGSRANLMLDAVFVAAFTAAKSRIGAMDVRFVEETDPVRQCLLEVYVAVALGTPYNDFDNH
ncbi:MAG: hypothetical protein JNM80_00310 [Phycisphaerae bacterium]|nr:hypothetical protein [Phycisphaerae bacterium]